MRVSLSLACEKCHTRNYFSSKNKSLNQEKLLLKKYCRHCHSVTNHKEKPNK